MKKIEIVEQIEEEKSVKITESGLIDLINRDGLISVLQNYEVPESFILKWGPKSSEFDGLDKNVVINILSLSEKFIKDAIEIDYFDLEDIYELNMKTYSDLSDKFIKIYEKYINWERMILYLCSSEKIDDISKFEWVIDKFNLWKLISASELPIDFVRKNKDKLDWRIVSIINDFSDEEKEEFVDEIPNYKEEWDKLTKESDNFTTIPESIKSTNLSIKDIRKIINNIDDESKKEKRFEVKHTMDELSNDDLLQIKEMIQSGRVNKF